MKEKIENLHVLSTVKCGTISIFGLINFFCFLDCERDVGAMQMTTLQTYLTPKTALTDVKFNRKRRYVYGNQTFCSFNEKCL